MISKYVFFSASLSVLIACSPDRTAQSDVDTVITDTSAALTDTVSRRPGNFKGMYIFGDEVSKFIDCDQPAKTYWVNDSTGRLKSLYDQATRYNSYPYESVYAELEGYLSGKGTMGYAAEYENVLQVTRIIKVETKNFRNDCYAYEFIAIGNEPFWEAAIIPAEKRIVLKDMGTEKIFDFPYKPAAINDDVYLYATANDRGDVLQITIRKEPCSDGMSDRRYSYSSGILINGRTLRGCAIRKGEKFGDIP